MNRKSFAAAWIGLACLISNEAAAETLTAKGVVRSLAEATITTDLGVKIKNLPFKDGESFRKDDVLISYDCARLRAEINAANAAAHADELVYANNKRLLARGALGANEMRISQARFEKSRSEASAIQIKAIACEFKAPFDGRVVQRKAQIFETPQANQPVLQIVNSQELEIEAIVPSRWLNTIKPGMAFTFTVDETGTRVDAQVTRLGATVDPVSQTIRIFGTLNGHQDSVLPGMSGTATFGSAGS